jgi:hypothetical protein
MIYGGGAAQVTIDQWTKYCEARETFIIKWNSFVGTVRYVASTLLIDLPLEYARGWIDGVYTVQDGMTFYLWMDRDLMDEIYKRYENDPVTDAALAFSNGFGTISTVAVGSGVLIEAAPVIVGSVEAIVAKLQQSGVKTKWANFDWSSDVLQHIFKDAPGHINTVDPQVMMKWVQAAEKIANNEANRVGPKVTQTGQTIYNVMMYAGEVGGRRLLVEVTIPGGRIGEFYFETLPGGR